MDGPPRRVGRAGHPADLRRPRGTICIPMRRRSRAASISTGGATCSPRSCASMPEPERAVLESEGVRSILSVPVFVRDGVVGLRRVRRLHRGSHLERCGDRCAPDGRGHARRAVRPGAGRAHAGAGSRSVPLDDRARSRRQLHRRDRRQRLDDLHQPAGRRPPRVFTTGVDRGRGAVAEPAAPRRSVTRLGGERATQRDRRAVPHGVPDVPSRRARRLGARRGHRSSATSAGCPGSPTA